MQATHGNELDATRDGACACVIAAVELVAGLVVISRARQGSGADYYVAPPGTDWEDLEELTRLEVSSIDHGVERQLRARMRQKIAQITAGAENSRGIAGVAAFRELQIRLATVEPT